MNRREALVRLGSLATAGLVTSRAAAQTSITEVSAAVTSSTASAAAAGKSFSIAHITDIHIFEKFDSSRWFATALNEIQSHQSKPSLILNTGDCVMETLKVDRKRADMLWGLWDKVVKDEVSVPLRSALGNHDCWALAYDKDPAVKEDPLYGKKLAMHHLGMARPYESFDHGDWHFIMLDSIFPEPSEQSGWISKLDDEQFEWLKSDLKASKHKNVVVCSHVPIIQMCSMTYMRPNGEGSYVFNHHIVMEDARRIISLFEKHPNVKLCLSGHIHLRDRIELNGITYICDGSVCGQWWRGPRMNIDPGYSILTLHPDGKFDYSYSGYGWEAGAELKAELAKEA